MATRAHSTEDEFEAIANRALEEAAKVDASVAAYQDGLITIIHICKTALEASREMDSQAEDV